MPATTEVTKAGRQTVPVASVGLGDAQITSLTAAERRRFTFDPGGRGRQLNSAVKLTTDQTGRVVTQLRMDTRTWPRAPTR